MSILSKTAFSVLTIAALASCSVRTPRRDAEVTHERTQSHTQVNKSTDPGASYAAPMAQDQGMRENAQPQNEQAGVAAGANAARAQNMNSNNMNGNSDNLGAAQTQEGKFQMTRPEQVTNTVMKKSEIPTVETRRVQADINRMNEDQFMAMGLTREVAKSAVEYRKSHGGKFHSVDELQQVPGMDMAMLQQMKDKLGVSGNSGQRPQG